MALQNSKIIPIPEPRGLPFIGNIAEFRSDDYLQDLNRLHDTYDGKSYVCVGSNKLVNELCDESRFQKSLKSELGEARLIVHDGLFTAQNDEEN
ncbi:uncharacterized protein CDV56_106025 [Aspergillus thermomutatus]|uniref:Uncharacterized protein n=1 Tax=Aspergillus thermomutatus TaxID=41047 RepID=A0A397H9Q2_ASPTH|nr:uncharacterized protein CDV56_106025 [Aspergillus thermomutatus]RHZ59801.1 hypothetical protein CDV56_106025 [Aspergillus thermomutatus]